MIKLTEVFVIGEAKVPVPPNYRDAIIYDTNDNCKRIKFDDLDPEQQKAIKDMYDYWRDNGYEENVGEPGTFFYVDGETIYCHGPSNVGGGVPEVFWENGSWEEAPDAPISDVNFWDLENGITNDTSDIEDL